jgi:hypothetical protein
MQQAQDRTHSTSTIPTSRTVLERFPAGAPRGSWPAEEFATARRNEGINAEVVMDLASDSFLVIVKAVS